MHSNFDLEIEAKTPEEQKYHDYMLPLMQAMVNDRNLTSLRALHPLLNPGHYTRANAIGFEFASEAAWTNFLGTFNLHFLSLSTFWKNWRSVVWRSIPTNTGPYKERETGDGKYYYIVELEMKVRPEGAAGYRTAVNDLVSQAVSAFKASSLVEISHWEALGHTFATNRISFEFDTFQAAQKLFDLPAFKRVLDDGPAQGGYLSWLARDVVIAPAPVSLASAEAQRAKYAAMKEAAAKEGGAKVEA